MAFPVPSGDITHAQRRRKRAVSTGCLAKSFVLFPQKEKEKKKEKETEKKEKEAKRQSFSQDDNITVKMKKKKREKEKQISKKLPYG